VLARGRAFNEGLAVATLTIELEDDLAHEVEEFARREHKSISEWFKDRVRAETERADALAAMEARAVANGYPPGWLTLFGSLVDDATFAGPPRSAPRPVKRLNGDRAPRQ